MQYNSSYNNRIRWVASSLLLTVLCLISCNDNSGGADRLNDAATLVESLPDSTFAILQDIDASRLNRRQKSLYALLDLQSRHKLSMQYPSDSLISIAIDYYGAYGADSLLMKSLFYRAQLYHSERLLSQAGADAARAWEIIKSTDNHYWKAKCAELTADIFNTSYNMQEGLKWCRVAADKYLLAGRIDNHLFSLCDLAGFHVDTGGTLQARNLHDSLAPIVAAHPEIPNLQGYYDFSAVHFYNLFGPLSKADSIYEHMKSTGIIKYLPASAHLAKASLLLKEGAPLKAGNLLDSVQPQISEIQDLAILYFNYVQVAKASGDYPALSAYTDSLLKYQKLVHDITLQQSAMTAQREYYRMVSTQQSAEMRKRERRTLTFASAGILVAMLAATIVCYILRRRKKQLDEKIESIMAISNQLEEENNKNEYYEEVLNQMETANASLHNTIRTLEIQTKEQEQLLAAQQQALRQANSETSQLPQLLSDNHSLRRLLSLHEKQSRLNEEKIIAQQRLLDEQQQQLRQNRLETAKLTEKLSAQPNPIIRRWDTLNMLCRELTDCNKSNHKIILTNIDKELKKLKSDKFFDSLELDLNRYQNNIICRLRNLCPSLSEKEIRYCILLFAGMNTAAVSLLMDIKTGTVYVTRQRIKEKIALLSDCTSKEVFLSYLRVKKEDINK